MLARIVSWSLLWSLALAAPASAAAAEVASPRPVVRPGSDTLATLPSAIAVLPRDGRALYLDAFAAARREIRIEICVLEDPEILAGLQAALARGVRVRAIVDRGKYDALEAERAHLATYLTSAGGELHLSNPIFPRSFPKVVLIDASRVVYGSACLDSLTFVQYRDFAHLATDRQLIAELAGLFENDWRSSSQVGAEPPLFNPTPPLSGKTGLLVAPVDASARMVALYQGARRTLAVYTELLGNPTLESELAAAVARGVAVRLITPLAVNGNTPEEDASHVASIEALVSVGVDVHVSEPPETAERPYMHARAAIVDGGVAYLGSISLSADAATVNREVGRIVREQEAVDVLRRQFEEDFVSRTREY
jgi:phosphatidylserine/phosphatidylglycerophosphate/cardiolipin synthase-like enzyme